MRVASPGPRPAISRRRRCQAQTFAIDRLERGGENLGRAPWDAIEDRVHRPGRANQAVAPVFRRPQHHLGPGAQPVEGADQDRRRQRRAVGPDNHRARTPLAFDQIGERPQDPGPEVAAALREAGHSPGGSLQEREGRGALGRERLAEREEGLRLRLPRGDRDQSQAVLQERQVDGEGLIGRERGSQATLDLAASRRAGEQDQGRGGARHVPGGGAYCGSQWM